MFDDPVIRVKEIINEFCDIAREGGDSVVEAALWEVLEDVLPGLTFQLSKQHADIEDAGDLIVVLIVFALAGLEDPLLKVLFVKYFMHAYANLHALAREHSYSPGGLRHYVRSFPKKVADQLIRKEYELNRWPEPTLTPFTRLNRLHRAFPRLTDRQVQVLELYVQADEAHQTGWLEKVGRHWMAQRLHISENVLKTHRRAIIKALSVCRMREAVDKAMVVIGNSVPARKD